MCQIVLFQMCTMAVKSFAFQSLPEKLLCPYRGGEGVVYLASLGHPTDTGLLLGKACYPCSR